MYSLFFLDVAIYLERFYLELITKTF